MMGRRGQNVMPVVALGLLVSMSVLLVGCASGESVTQASFDVSKVQEVAVVDVVGAIQGDAAKNQISDFFGIELLKKGYTPVERAQLQTLAKEQQFQNMDFTLPENAVKAGRLLNVSAVVIINVLSGEEMSMTAKMINVEKGTMLWMGSGAYQSQKGLLGRFGVTVSDGNADSRTAGGRATSQALGAGNEAMTPQQCQMAKDVLRKICESLPSKLPAPVKTK